MNAVRDLHAQRRIVRGVARELARAQVVQYERLVFTGGPRRDGIEFQKGVRELMRGLIDSRILRGALISAKANLRWTPRNLFLSIVLSTPLFSRLFVAVSRPVPRLKAVTFLKRVCRESHAQSSTADTQSMPFHDVRVKETRTLAGSTCRLNSESRWPAGS